MTVGPPELIVDGYTGQIDLDQAGDWLSINLAFQRAGIFDLSRGREPLLITHVAWPRLEVAPGGDYLAISSRVTEGVELARRESDRIETLGENLGGARKIDGGD